MCARINVELTDEQAATLKMWAGSGRTEQRMALRARVILAAAEGLTLKEIEKRTGLNWQSCLKWRKRFLQHGLEGLRDRAGRGRPQTITPEERTRVIAMACTTPIDGSSRWRVRKLAEVTGHSKSAIQAILAEGATESSPTKQSTGAARAQTRNLKKNKQLSSACTWSHPTTPLSFA